MKSKLMLLLALFVFGVGVATAQTKKISGKVIDEEGQPLVGATVRVAGQQSGTITDLDGYFAISVPDGGKIEFSYIGMVSRVLDAKNNMRVILISDNTVLNDVVVTAYGTQSRQSLTGSVSVVDTEDLEVRIGSNVLGALEGSAPGVQVNNTYGEPGSSPSIRIRGFSSVTGSNSPLFVVDGVPFDGSFSTDINPADIESISILKDAASAALYGSRASNGVVLVTTKKAKGAYKPSIELNVNHGWYTRGIKEYERMGVKDWMESEWLALRNSQVTNGMSIADANAWTNSNLIASSIGRNIFDKADDALFDSNGKLIANQIAGYNDLDWEDAIERVGQRQEYTVSGSVSNEKYNVYSSLGYLNEKGYVNSTDLERYTGRVNSTFTPTNWLKGGINLNLSHSDNNYNEKATGNYYANPFYAARYMAPVYPIYNHNADGSIVYGADGKPEYDTTSPYLTNRHIVYEVYEDKEHNLRNQLGIQTFATVTLPYGFSATIKADMNNINKVYQKYNNPNIGDGASNNGRMTSNSWVYKTYNVQELINWNYTFDGLHKVEVLLGHENYKWNQSYTRGMNTNMSMPGIMVVGNFATNSYFDGYDNEEALESYMVRGRYNFDERYYAEASWRRDGSSRFHKDNRWGNFFSVGAAWNIKREAFMKDVDWVTNLKLRASYGEVGNNAGSGLYGYMATYEIDKNGGIASLLKSALAANDVQWETTQTIDLGVDARLFDRLNVSLGYFDKRSKDLLFDVKLPLSAGSWSHGDNWNMTQLMNVGTISNKGIEFAIDGDIIKTHDWNWNLGMDLTYLKNEIVKLYKHEDVPNGSRRYSEGHSIYEWYTYHYEGVDQMTGKALYTIDDAEGVAAKAEGAGALVTINGVDYTTQTSFAKKDWRGSALPKVYGAIHTDLSWKNLSLGMVFTYSLGGKVYDGTYQSLMGVSNSSASGSAIHVDALNSWSGVPEGMTEGSVDRITTSVNPALNFTTSSYNNATSDRWLTSGSYLVCKNINLSYSLPKVITTQLGIEGLSVNAGVENAFTLTKRQGMNPQYSFSGGYDDTYVTARVWNVGLKLRF